MGHRKDAGFAAIIAWLFWINPQDWFIEAFPASYYALQAPSISALAAVNNYGKGAEIWPESNNDNFELSDSFPNGNVPLSAILAIEQPDMQSIHQRAEYDSSRRRRTKKYIKRILRQAASKEELENETTVGKLPIAIAVALLIRGWVRPMDVGLVACWTAYLTILNMSAQSISDLSGAPNLPACPPQGHVPFLMSNPLGRSFEQSTLYRRWLQLGALVGLVGPLAWLFVATTVVPRTTLSTTAVSIEAARTVARPAFLLCCQMTTEAFSKHALMPLPLRILVPVLYNASRLFYLWSWATTTTTTQLGSRCLGAVNLAYWSLNLFAFLVPIASIRYMRAHFFGVEAQEVTTRIGLEETVGLIPNNGDGL